MWGNVLIAGESELIHLVVVIFAFLYQSSFTGRTATRQFIPPPHSKSVHRDNKNEINTFLFSLVDTQWVHLFSGQRKS